MRGLVPFEIALVLALALAPIPDALPIAIPLAVAASIAKWIHGASWGDVVHANSLHAVVGLGAGIAGLLLGLLGGTPLVEALTSRTVEWSSNAVVRGNTAMLGGVVIFAATVALCMEAALRGWIVERVLDLAPSQKVIAVLVGAFSEAILTPGDFAMRIGAGVFGIGLGWIYIAANRNVLAPILARMTFAIAIVILEGMRVIG
jgi:uncharacterized membrane protein